MNDSTQQLLQLPSLIEHTIGDEHIHQRPDDGYVNATQACKAAGKSWADYYRLATTKAFLDALSLDMGIPISKLVWQFIGKPAQFQGTWVHPDVAVNLGQWLSPEFAVAVSRFVNDWRERKPSGRMPFHVQRYTLNNGRIHAGFFSMLNETYLILLWKIDDAGLVLPDKMMPDISTGRMFSGFLRRRGIDPSQFPDYTHVFPPSDNRPPVQARMYPDKYLGDFRVWLNTDWMLNRAEGYFSERFPKALPIVREHIALLEEHKKE